MPNRSIYESITSSESLADLTGDEERLFWRLVVLADDFGRFDARSAVLRARGFTLVIDRVSEDDIRGWLGRLEEVGLVRTYEVDGRPYLPILTWSKHQRTRAESSKDPDPPATDDDRPHSPATDDDRARYPVPVSGSGSGDEIPTGSPPPCARGREETGDEKRPTRNVYPPPEVAALFEAFVAAGEPLPALDTAERRVAAALLQQFPPGDLVACWGDIAGGRYGDDFDRSNLSFVHLSRRNRVANWRRWREGDGGDRECPGAPERRTRGAARGGGGPPLAADQFAGFSVRSDQADVEWGPSGAVRRDPGGGGGQPGAGRADQGVVPG